MWCGFFGGVAKGQRWITGKSHGQSKSLKKPDATRSPNDTDPKKLGSPNVVWVFRGSCQRWITGKSHRQSRSLKKPDVTRNPNGKDQKNSKVSVRCGFFGRVVGGGYQETPRAVEVPKKAECN